MENLIKKLKEDIESLSRQIAHCEEILSHNPQYTDWRDAKEQLEAKKTCLIEMLEWALKSEDS